MTLCSRHGSKSRRFGSIRSRQEIFYTSTVTYTMDIQCQQIGNDDSKAGVTPVTCPDNIIWAYSCTLSRSCWICRTHFDELDHSTDISRPIIRPSTESDKTYRKNETWRQISQIRSEIRFRCKRHGEDE